MKKFIIGVVAFVLFAILNSTMIFAAEPVTWEPNTPNVTLENENLTARIDRTQTAVKATVGKSSGKWYWEVRYDQTYGLWTGIINDNNERWLYEGRIGNLYYNPNLTHNYNGLVAQTGVNVKNGDIVGMALDLENSTLIFYVNGVKINGEFNNIPSGEYFATMYSSTGTTNYPKGTANFGATEFSYPIPEGYLPYDQTGEPIPTPKPSLFVLLEVGEEAQLSLAYILGEPENYIWSSSDTEIATVNETGKVTAISEGVAQVNVISNDGSFNDYIKVKVIAKEEIEEIRLAVDLEVGKSVRLYFDSEGTVIWTSLDPNIAIVSSDGRVAAVSKGLVIIQAESNGDVGMIYIRVR